MFLLPCFDDRIKVDGLVCMLHGDQHMPIINRRMMVVQMSMYVDVEGSEFIQRLMSKYNIFIASAQGEAIKNTTPSLI